MESNKRLIVIDGGGLCSCLTVRLDNAIAYRKKNGYYPDEIDSSLQFSMHKDDNLRDMSYSLFGEYKANNNLHNIDDFNHGWQYAWYDEIQIEHLSKIANMVCPVSQHIGDKSYDMMKLIGERTCVLYRGNDKCKEIPSAPYDKLIEMAKDTESKSFLVQTDEYDFYEYFKSVFPDTIRYTELPMINKNTNDYVLPPKGQREKFSINFISALRAISQSNKLCIITGNTALWTMFYRGNTKNVWQYNGNYNKWKKL